MGNDPTGTAGESGFALAVAITTILPLMLIIVAGAGMMERRNSRLLDNIRSARALQAAESGLEIALFHAASGTLESGTLMVIDLGNGTSVSIDPLLLSTDGLDNDNDGDWDEADENVFQVTSTGVIGSNAKSLMAVIRNPRGAVSVEAAMTMTFPTASLQASGLAFSCTGVDTNLDGTPGPAPQVAGIMTEGDPDDLIAQISPEQEPLFTGTGGPPSILQTSQDLDVQTIIDDLKGPAPNEIIPGSYEFPDEVPNFGDSASDDWVISYCPGNLTVTGNQSGAGILLVEGDLQGSGAFQYNGLIVVTGVVTLTGGGSGTIVRGAIIGGQGLTITGSAELLYSSEALGLATQGVGGAFTIDEWRVVSN